MIKRCYFIKVKKVSGDRVAYSYSTPVQVGLFAKPLEVYTDSLAYHTERLKDEPGTLRVMVFTRC